MTRHEKGKSRDGILKEAWDNMREDFARVLPAAVPKESGKGRRGWQVILLIAVLELVVLGAVGKFVYDWLVG